MCILIYLITLSTHKKRLYCILDIVIDMSRPHITYMTDTHSHTRKISFLLQEKRLIQNTYYTCSRFMSTIPLLLKASSSQCTKIVGKSINPHYNATMHFTGVTNDIMLSTSIHAIIFGKSTQFLFDISLIMHFDKFLRFFLNIESYFRLLLLHALK